MILYAENMFYYIMISAFHIRLFQLADGIHLSRHIDTLTHHPKISHPSLYSKFSLPRAISHFITLLIYYYTMSRSIIRDFSCIDSNEVGSQSIIPTRKNQFGINHIRLVFVRF
jgi:hypothetical protein